MFNYGLGEIRSSNMYIIYASTQGWLKVPATRAITQGVMSTFSVFILVKVFKNYICKGAEVQFLGAPTPLEPSLLVHHIRAHYERVDFDNMHLAMFCY